jgi:hypothetical protein
MATSYTDVDRLVFERWEEVLGLRRAFDELQGRVEEVFVDVGTRLEKWANSCGYNLESDPRKASYYAWKQTWETRKRNEVIYYEVGALAPKGYRKIDSEHPYLCLCTELLENLKMKEDERAAFARELRQILGNQASQWLDDDVSDLDAPLGRNIADLGERDRVDLISNPDKLYEFVRAKMEELFTLSDAIDQTLAKFRPEFVAKASSK